jgi:positive regulator of sigma E activity
MGKAWPICCFVACLLYFLHLLASHLTKELNMNDVHIVIGCFTFLMCAMSLAASYYEAKEKSKAQSKDIGI